MPNMSISLNSFSDVDLDDDVVRYLRHANRATSFASQPAASCSSLASSFDHVNDSFSNSDVNRNTNANTQEPSNVFISGLVLQRGVSKVL